MHNILERLRKVKPQHPPHAGSDPPKRLGLNDLKALQAEVGDERTEDIAQTYWNEWVNEDERRIDRWGRLAAPELRRHRANAETPVLIGREDVAALLGLGVRTVDRMNASEAMPKPKRFGTRVKWRRNEILMWVSEGSPSRREWNAAVRAKHYKF